MFAATLFMTVNIHQMMETKCGVPNTDYPDNQVFLSQEWELSSDTRQNTDEQEGPVRRGRSQSPKTGHALPASQDPELPSPASLATS